MEWEYTLDFYYCTPKFILGHRQTHTVIKKLFVLVTFVYASINFSWQAIIVIVILSFSTKKESGRRAVLKSIILLSISHVWLCDPKDCSTLGFPIHHQLPELTNSCLSNRWCHPNISSSIVPFSSCLQSFPASGSFPMS